jgi:hypothetical protein
MKVSFKQDEKTGPVIGKTKLSLIYSAADVPGLDTPDGTATTHEQKSGSGGWTLAIKPGTKSLELQAER